MQVMDAFDKHCNPKKNETVNRFKFFRVFKAQANRSKSLSQICNFDDLKDSLVRDLIICGIQDKQLCEDLLKYPCLDLQQCLDV